MAAVTLTAGVLFLLLAVFKMGWLSQFLSKAVITGFLFGAAIEVVTGELPKITGTDAEGENTWQKLDSWLDGVDGYDGTTLLVGIVSLVAIVGIRFLRAQAAGRAGPRRRGPAGGRGVRPGRRGGRHGR